MFSPHLSISMLLFGSIQCIFKLADQYNIADRLNGHFLNCFQSVMQAFNSEEVIKTNNQANVSNIMTELI